MMNRRAIANESKDSKRRKVFVENKHRQSQEVSDTDENLQAIFNRQQKPKNQSTLAAIKSSETNNFSERIESGPQVTQIRIGAQKIQHKFALKGPNMADSEM